MSIDTAVATTPTDEDWLHDTFVKTLVQQLRAQDTHGTWEGKTRPEAAGALHPERRAAPRHAHHGRPRPRDTVAAGPVPQRRGPGIERATGCMVSPMTRMSHEGFGRTVLTTGRLIVVNRYLRDVHRFGFPSLGKLAEAGNKLVAEGIGMIEKYPEGRGGDLWLKTSTP
jgi:probable nitrogen fixation protein